MISSLKKKLKNNKISYAVIYFIKYVVVRPIKRFIKHIEINIHISFNKYSKNGKKILKLKNSKFGKSCIIIGNGPSVSMNDLSVIAASGIDCFGANRIMDILDKTKWRPTYICACDSTFLTSVNSTTTCDYYLKKAQHYGVKSLFFADYFKHHMKVEKENIYYIDFYESGEYSDKVKDFSDNAAFYISELGTVTNFSIQLAVYMGYKKIYLYGMDNSYTKYFGDDGKFHVDNSVQSHASGIKLETVDIPSQIVPKNKFQASYIGGFGDIRKANIGYKLSRDYCESHGIEIANISRGGHLEVFKRIPFEDIFMKL